MTAADAFDARNIAESRANHRHAAASRTIPVVVRTPTAATPFPTTPVTPKASAPRAASA